MKNLILFVFTTMLLFSCEESLIDKATKSSASSSIELRNSTSCDQCPNLLSNPQLKGNWEGLENGTNSFGEGLVDFWRNSSITPHHIRCDADLSNCSFTNLSVEEAINCIGSSWFTNPSKGKSEAVVTDINLINSDFHEYCISILFREILCNSADFHPGSNLILRVANDIPDQQYNFQYLEYLPELLLDFGGGEIIAEINSNFDDFETQEFVLENYSPLSNYSQFEIVNMIGEQETGGTSNIEIQNCSITCENTGITQIIATESANGITFQLTNESSASIAKYNWDFGNGEMSSESTPEIDFLTTGSHVICVDITDEFGCCGSTCIEIEIQNQCDYTECFSDIIYPAECLGSPTSFLDLFVILPNTNTLTNLSLEPGFNFPYCSSFGNCSDYNGLTAQGNTNIIYPLLADDINNWLNANNYSGFAFITVGGTINDPDFCRGPRLHINQSNVDFRYFEFKHGWQEGSCSDIQETSFEFTNCATVIIQ